MEKTILEYKEITDEIALKHFAELNIDSADTVPAEERDAYVQSIIETMKLSRCIGIYDSGRLIGSIVTQLRPPYRMLDLIPDEAEEFYTRENVRPEDCVQMLYAVFPQRSATERLQFYKRTLEEMIAPGKEHILIYYSDDKHNRHQLYRRMKPEIIKEKESALGFIKRLVFVRRSYLLQELERVEQQLNQRRTYKLPERQTF